MTYKPEDIKPKRYPDEKPKLDGVHWGYPDYFEDWFGYIYPCGYPWDERPIQWFIDIPGAPPELKPIAYPENKPEQEGEYWCHIGTDHIHAIEHDSWEVMRWEWDDYNKKNDWNGYRILVDYFIPYRLDKESEMADTDGMRLKALQEKLDEIKAPIVEVMTEFLDGVGYDVVKREPEIKACPACKYKQSEYREDYGGCWICLNPFCRLAGPHDDKDANKWNALPRRNGEE